jgi:hypothetical protein
MGAGSLRRGGVGRRAKGERTDEASGGEGELRLVPGPVVDRKPAIDGFTGHGFVSCGQGGAEHVSGRQ